MLGFSGVDPVGLLRDVMQCPFGRPNGMACKKIGVTDSRGRVCDVVVDGPALEERRVVRPVDGRDDQRVLQHVVVRRRVNLEWKWRMVICKEKISSYAKIILVR